MRLLVGDVRAVIHSLGYKRAVIIGHDWGGAIAWKLAMHLPEVVEKLIVLNIPHPHGLARELANNPEQRKNSKYAHEFQEEGAHLVLAPQELASWVSDSSVRKKYVEVFERSDIEAMLNYYKRNYPREPYREVASPLIKVQAPVLMIHGLQDPHLLHSGIAGTWDWVEDLTLVTVPRASHFVHLDAANNVCRTIAGWLDHSRYSVDGANGEQFIKCRATPSKRALREAIDYVGDNLEKELTLAEIAGSACMSPYHFSHLFKESTGLTPHQYVIERRVERARELLGRSSFTISEVALSCGFADQSHLTRHFKRLMGLTPAGFRKAVGGKQSNNVQKPLR